MLCPECGHPGRVINTYKVCEFMTQKWSCNSSACDVSFTTITVVTSVAPKYGEGALATANKLERGELVVGRVLQKA